MFLGDVKKLLSAGAVGAIIALFVVDDAKIVQVQYITAININMVVVYV